MLHRFIAYINGMSTMMLRNDANYEKNYIAGRYGAVAREIREIREIRKTEQINARDETC